MHRVVWLTDLHLNFVEPHVFDKFATEVRSLSPDSVLLSGDVAESSDVVSWLELLIDRIDCPLHFVLGNHDFYHGGIQAVRERVGTVSKDNQNLIFLSRTTSPVTLTQRAGLVGHDGWADAREGDYNRSLVMMNDYLLIEELAAFSKQDRLAELHRLGDEAAAHVRGQLMLALPEFEQVFVLTHVPPFRGACWYQGNISDDEWAPHFVCQALGRAILDVASIFPSKEITVLCGHTHSGGEYQAAENVRVLTGAAEYGFPQVVKTFDLH